MWHAICDTWHLTPDNWHLISDMHHLTPDTWHLTCDTLNINLCKLVCGGEGYFLIAPAHTQQNNYTVTDLVPPELCTCQLCCGRLGGCSCLSSLHCFCTCSCSCFSPYSLFSSHLADPKFPGLWKESNKTVSMKVNPIFIYITPNFPRRYPIVWK